LNFSRSHNLLTPKNLNAGKAALIEQVNTPNAVIAVLICYISNLFFFARRLGCCGLRWLRLQNHSFTFCNRNYSAINISLSP